MSGPIDIPGLQIRKGDHDYRGALHREANPPRGLRRRADDFVVAWHIAPLPPRQGEPDAELRSEVLAPDA